MLTAVLSPPGECWAGNSGTHNYKILGEDYAGCVQDDYQLCWSGTRYCVGKNWRNMVYQIGRDSFFLSNKLKLYFRKIGL